MGGLGDLVLLAPALAALRSSWPETHFTLACRREYEAIAALYPIEIDRLVPIDFDPYTFVPTDGAELERICALLREFEPGCSLLVSAELSPTWLTSVLSSALTPGRTIRADAEASSVAVIADILERLGLQPPNAERYTFAPGIAESKRYEILLSQLGAPPVQASLRVRDELRARAQSSLAAAKFAGPYLAVFPLGNRNVRIKQWPLDRFGTVIKHVCASHRLTPLIVGDERDEPAIDAFIASLRDLSVDAIAHVSRNLDVDVTAAVITHASAFLGNDTGLSHLAAGLGIAGVTIYGGGTWPSFAPWARGTTGVVHPLPCFGCGWDCAFGTPVCIDWVAADDVIKALDHTLTRPAEPHQVLALHTSTSREEALISMASDTYRKAQQDRHRRYDIIVQLRRAREKAESRVADLQRAAQESGEEHSGEVRDIAQLRLEMLMEAQRDLRSLTLELERWHAAEDSNA